jgi:Mechanosensitive ion channel
MPLPVVAVALHIEPVMRTTQEFRRTLVALLAGTSLLGAAPRADAQDTTPSPGDHALTAESVMAPLQRSIAWYQDARLAMQSIRGVLDGDFDRGEEETTRRALQRAFDTARARAAVLAQEEQTERPGAPPRPARAKRRAELEAAIERGERDVTRLKGRLGTAAAAARPALERELAAASNRLELGRVQLEFLTKLDRVDTSAPGEEADLPDQIQALQDTLPPLTSATGAPAVVTTSPRAAAPTGAWTLVYRLLALQRHRSALKELTRATSELADTIRGEIRATRQTIRPMMARLRELANRPAGDGTSGAEAQEEFRALLARTKLLGAVMLPLREESALLRRYTADVETWRRAIDREIGQAVRGLALELVGIVIALGAIFLGSVLWRIAVVRYVTNDYHRRLLLTARHIVVVTAVALVLVFHFASELTALVAVLGFAAAGIAFALQNVILAVAGYFSMVAPNGIRVGDRVSLQGPFGYVHGEVIEIGVVRTRLRELTGDPLQPTGRIMVFPNSVAFTGSFIKHPPPDIRRSSIAA